MAFLLVTACVVYALLLFWLIKRVYLPRLYLESAPAAAGGTGDKYRLARSVRSILSVLHAFALVAVIAWLPLSVAMTISQLGDPEWGLDISAYSGFAIDLDALPAVEAEGLRQPLIRGKSEISIDSSDKLAWLLFLVSNLVTSLIVLYVLLQARNIFVMLGRGEIFAHANVARLRRIAYAVIGAYVAAPLVQYFGWGAVIDRITITPEGLRLYPAFELNLVGILIGLGCYVLSGVIEEAAELRDEQRLTV